MLLVSDIADIVKASTLTNIVLAKNDSALIKLINLGVSELYRRFNLSIKIETIITNPNLALYELRNEDVSLLLSVYNSKGEELTQTDILGSHYDYKIINYRSFLLRQPQDDLLFAVYKASSPRLIELKDEIVLPDSMVDALLSYVSYLGHNTINRDNKNEAAMFYQRFNDACKELEDQGYRIDISNESINMRLQGYV